MPSFPSSPRKRGSIRASDDCGAPQASHRPPLRASMARRMRQVGDLAGAVHQLVQQRARAERRQRRGAAGDGEREQGRERRVQHFDRALAPAGQRVVVAHGRARVQAAMAQDIVEVEIGVRQRGPDPERARAATAPARPLRPSRR